MSRNISRSHRLAKVFVATCIATLTALPSHLHADLARSTAKATGAVGEGQWVMENSLQLEHGKDGDSWTLGTDVQHTPTFLPRLSLLLETAPWHRERPKNAPNAEGAGDTDISAFYTLAPASEEAFWPALVVGAKIKLPTATNRELGTGEFDYSGLITIGREFGNLEVNLELEYRRFGQPGAADGEAPERLRDQTIYTLSVDYSFTERLSSFVELSGNTKPTDAEAGSNALTFGTEYDIELSDSLTLFTQVTVDTDQLCAVKVGLEWTW